MTRIGITTPLLKVEDPMSVHEQLPVGTQETIQKEAIDVSMAPVIAHLGRVQRKEARS